MVGNTGLQTIKAVGRSDLLLRIELYKKPVFLALLLLGLHYSVHCVAIVSCLYSIYAMIINFGTMGKIINYSAREQIKDIMDVGKLSILMILVLLSLNAFCFKNNAIELFFKIGVGVASYCIASVVFHSQEYFYILGFIRQKMGH